MYCLYCGSTIKDEARFCEACGREQRGVAITQPTRQAIAPAKRGVVWPLVAVGIGGLFLLLVIGSLSDMSNPVRPDNNVPQTHTRAEMNSVSMRNNDADLLIERCGQPDVDDSTALDNPRPPIVTRWLVYRVKDIRIQFYVGNGRVSDPPPYAWKVMGFENATAKKALSPQEALGLMPCIKGANLRFANKLFKKVHPNW